MTNSDREAAIAFLARHFVTEELDKLGLSDSEDFLAMKIAVLATALEDEIRAQGGNPAKYQFFTGDSNE